MSELKRSIRHGQEWETARTNFERGIRNAESQYGQHLRPVEWSDDRTRARLSGAGFNLLLTLDEEYVHVTGHVPFFLRFLEGPVLKMIEQSIQAPE